MVSGQITNHRINLDLIKVIEFSLKIYDVWRHLLVWVGGWVGLGQITKYQINLDIIEIIQFCFKIYNLWRHPHL